MVHRRIRGKWVWLASMVLATAIMLPVPFSTSISIEGPPSISGVGDVHWNGLIYQTTPGQSTVPEGLSIIQFTGPVEGYWLSELGQRGIEPIWYVPHYSFIVNAESATTVSDLDFVFGITDYTPGMKVSRNIIGNHVIVELLSPMGTLATAQVLKSHGEIIGWEENGDRSTVEMIVTSEPLELGGLDEVLWVSKFLEPWDQVQQSETESEIIGGGWAAETPYGGPGSMVNLAGWNGTGVMISLCDGGIGDGIPGSGHEDFGPRFVGGIQYINGVGVYYPAGNIAGDGNSHGTHCCGCFGADGSRGTGVQYHTGYYVGMGSAPDCTVFDQRIFSGNWGGPDTIAQWQGLFQDSYDNDIEICSFSWGTRNTEGDYDYQCVAFDAAIRDCSLSEPDDQPLIVFKSAGNDGNQGIVSPGCAKNIILVGGTQNYYPDGTSYGCPQNRNNIDAMYSSSSRGPTNDNRIKPDVVAPADYTLSTRSSATSDDGAGLYTGDSLDRYNWNIGTSFSGPYGAGSCGCIFEWFNDTYGAEPTPAMVRACLINSAVDISGTSGGVGDIPNYQEGWGRIYLPEILMPSVNVMLEDSVNPLETGETYGVPTFVVYDDPSEPLKITMTWVDPAAAEGAGIQLINNLNLRVTAPDNTTTYYGNSFSGGYSQDGLASPWDYEGAANFDSRNNVECVYIAPGDLQTGLYTVEVIAENVPVDAVNGTPESDQDFALVMYNALPGVLPDPPQFDGLTDVKNPGTGLVLDLEWLAGSDFDGEYPLTYHIFRDTVPGLPSRIVLGVDTPHATYTPGGASPGDPISWQDTVSITEDTTYYYWVVARDAGGVAPVTGPLYEDPPNQAELSATAESLLFFQVQSPAPGQRNLNNEPFEPSGQTSVTPVMDAVGDWQVDTASGQWVSDPFPAAGNLDGVWKFFTYGRMNNERADGYLYARVFRQSDDALMFTTSLDDENISAFTTEYHRFEWQHTATGTPILSAGDAYYVELWLNISSVTQQPGVREDLFLETWPNMDTSGGWQGPADTPQDEAGWIVGFNPSDPGDTIVSDWSTGTPPGGHPEGDLNDCDDGTVTPPFGPYDWFWTGHIDLSAHSDCEFSYNWQIDGFDATGDYAKVFYSTTATAATVSSTTDWVEMFSYDGSTVHDVWAYGEHTIPPADAASTFSVIFVAETDMGGEDFWFDNIQVSGVPAGGPPDGQFTFAYDFALTPSAVHQPSGPGPPPQAYDIDLTGFSAGDWVFVSFPIEITGDVPTVFDDSAFGDGGTTWDCVQWFDNAVKAWTDHNTHKPATLRDNSVIDNTGGFWIHLTAAGGDEMLTTGLEGFFPSAVSGIDLFAGWNLVGYPSATTRLASDALAGTSADMIAFHSPAAPYRIGETTDLSSVTMDHGNAYWVRVPADTVWNIDT
jgi:hypothetical protein